MFAKLKKSLLFSQKKLRRQLGMGLTRLRLVVNKKANTIKVLRGQVAQLLRQQKWDTARLRVEEVIRLEYDVEAHEILGLYADLLSNRLTLIAEQDETPPELLEAIATLCYGASRSDVEELREARQQFAYKYTAEFIDCISASPASASPTRQSHVNTKVSNRLELHIPSAALCLRKWEEIARDANVPLNLEEARAAMQSSVIRDSPHQVAIGDLLRNPDPMESGDDGDSDPRSGSGGSSSGGSSGGSGAYCPPPPPPPPPPPAAPGPYPYGMPSGPPPLSANSMPVFYTGPAPHAPMPGGVLPQYPSPAQQGGTPQPFTDGAAAPPPYAYPYAAPYSMPPPPPPPYGTPGGPVIGGPDDQSTPRIPAHPATPSGFADGNDELVVPRGPIVRPAQPPAAAAAAYYVDPSSLPQIPQGHVARGGVLFQPDPSEDAMVVRPEQPAKPGNFLQAVPPPADMNDDDGNNDDDDDDDDDGDVDDAHRQAREAEMRALMARLQQYPDADAQLQARASAPPPPSAQQSAADELAARLHALRH